MFNGHKYWKALMRKFEELKELKIDNLCSADYQPILAVSISTVLRLC